VFLEPLELATDLRRAAEVFLLDCEEGDGAGDEGLELAASETSDKIGERQ
jgi:hypothetical protein